MAGSDLGDLESVKLLSPEVKAFRARVVAYLLDPAPDKWSHHCCEDLDDVVKCLKLVHFQQSLQYTTKAWHVIEDYGFICEMEMDPLSVTVDMHHLDSWFDMVESMDDESRQLYDKLRQECHQSPKSPASKEYQHDYQRFCGIAAGALTAHISTIKNFFAVHRPDNEFLQRIPALVSWLVDKTEKEGRWEEAIPENLRDKLAGFTYKWMKWLIFRSMARRARTNPSDDSQEQVIWDWVAGRTVMCLEADSDDWKSHFSDFRISKRNLIRSLDQLKEKRSELSEKAADIFLHVTTAFSSFRVSRVK